MNPANFEAYVDPNSGEWIRLKHGEAKDVVWRPTDMSMTEDGRFKFDVEFLTGPGTTLVTEENQDDIANQINAIMHDLLAAEAADLQMIAEAAEKEDAGELDEVQGLSDDLLQHIEQNELLEGGHKVSEALLPQDVQGDLQQISSVLGGLKPQ